MDKKYGILTKAEYQEPRCVLCAKPDMEGKEPIPQDRILKKLDEYLDKNDLEGAERHLLYWLTEAQTVHDKRGQLMLHNELMGNYRKQNKEEYALENAQKALSLIEELEMSDTISAGTTYVNAATVFEHFGQISRSLDLFEKAKPLYQRNLSEGDFRLGSFFNNMGMTLASAERYGESYEMFQKALACMQKNSNGQLEEAMTYLNMANAVEKEHGIEKAEKKICQYLDCAQEKLDDPTVIRNGYYAFVCDKCQTVFDYYGYFLFAQELRKRVKEIYERN